MIELYRIKDGQNEYYYTSSNKEFTVNNIDSVVDGITFYPRAIQRSEISIDSIEKDNFDFEVPISMKPFDEFIFINPNDSIFVYLYNDKGESLYTGKVSNVEFNLKKHNMKIKVSNIISILSNNIPKNNFSPSCSYDLYSKDCGILEEDRKVIYNNTEYQINSNLEIQLLITAPDINYFSNGFCIIDNQNNYIISHNTDIIKFLYPIKNTSFTGDIYIYPGCSKTINECKNKFNNLENFGGFPFVPKSDPFLKI